jgi:hypothetical protein
VARHVGRGRVAKPYCEAFPGLKLAELIGEWNAGSRTCEWTSELGIVVGHITLTEVTAERICFDYLFLGTCNVAAGRGSETIRLQPREEGRARRKPAFLCPISRRPAGCLYYVDQHWACKTIHNIVYIAQRLDPFTSILLDCEHLGRRVSLGRYAFASVAEFMRAKLEIAKMTALLVEREIARLPTRLSYRAFPRWLDAGETPKITVTEADEGYGWKPGQAWGFERFYVGRVTRAGES